ncbi:MAG: hypothetical protein GXP29_04710 [Planctomycetes bacterium]|nr:hypothetical protein [Planctomycetota bacterium]
MRTNYHARGNHHTRGLHNGTRLGFALATVFALFLTTHTQAEERKFTILMVVPPKSVSGSYPPASVTDVEPQNIFSQYFDDFAPDIDSFHEYWKEISYGEVTVSGDVFDWGEIPWPLLPVGGAQEILFEDLDGDFLLTNFVGEEFDQSSQQFIIDYNGSFNDNDSTGTEDDPFTDAFEIPPGLEDTDTNGNDVWTPGERFLDVDGDGRYDALIESTADGYGKPIGAGEDVVCEEDGLITSTEFCDLDGDDQWNFSEPFEDFLVIYDPNGETPAQRWIALDPSENNTDEGDADSVGSRAWAIAYIKRNYPGDADALIARCGNGKYDGPDSWVERGNTKLQQAPDLFLLQPPVTTPAPGAAYATQVSYQQWWQDYWRDSHFAVGIEPTPAPDPPEWVEGIPDLRPFNPLDPALGAPFREFRPNVGGTNTRLGDELCDPDENDTNDADGDPLNPQCLNPATDEADPGNGDMVAGNDGIGNSDIIQPDATGYYDGPAEFQDLPSSIYHTRSFWTDPPSYSGFEGSSFVGSNGSGNATTSGDWYGGDGRMGEVTSPFNTDPWGHDRGPNDPSVGLPTLDNVIPPAGPFAFNIHGTSGYDGGNVLSLEFLTWRKDDDATSGVAMKRDFNLDGLLDQGEVRNAGTENYSRDADPATLGDGSPAEAYPFNRRRITEDAVEVHDGAADWDNLIMSTRQTANVGGVQVETGSNYLHSTFLLPSGIVATGLAPGGRGLFQLPAPGMDLPIQVREEALGALSPILFSDFGSTLGDVGEAGGSVDGAGKQLMIHEWLHVWEGYPDLYDYDVYLDNAIVNTPVGAWDIMAGGFVHPSPVLKEKRLGNGGLGTAHAPWIDVIDLTDILRPGVPTTIEIPDFAFNPSNSVYYYQNRANNADPALEERFYFWRLTGIDPPDLVGPGGNVINFSRNAPGANINNGVMIMHTNLPQALQDTTESQPLLQRVGSNFVYAIVQADNGSVAGDAGDPFPGSSGAPSWLESGASPNSSWYSGEPSGIQITQFVQLVDSTRVTFLWTARLVPSLSFLNPPLGLVIGSKYKLRYEAFDFDGGTAIEFYFDTDSSGYDGTLLSPTASKGPGLINGTYDVPLISLPGDGTYFFYARLVPGPGQDGRTDPTASPARAATANRGSGKIANGMIAVGTSGLQDAAIGVNLATSKFEIWDIVCSDDTVPGAETWSVFGALSGLQSEATTGVPYTSDNGEITFKIEWTGDSGSNANVSNLNVFKLVDPAAGFEATTFGANDIVRITGGTGAVLGFYTILSVPSDSELILAGNPGNSGGANNVAYRVHSFSAGDDQNDADAFTFFTTGSTAYSAPITFQNGNVIPKLFPELTVTYPDAQNPLVVRFDASGTRDELFELNNPDLRFTWDFGDGEDLTSTGAIVEHTYAQSFPLGANIQMTVENTDPDTGNTISDTINRNIDVGPRDDDQDGVDNASDNCPNIPNANQTNSDTDSAGDACDDCPFDSSKIAPDVCPCGEVPTNPLCTSGCICVPDCNTNGIGDTVDIANGADDCDGNNVPDECQSQADCDSDNVLDFCALAGGSEDCNNNTIPDECEAQDDCNTNSVQDICEIAGNDCNNNATLDACESQTDCDNNNIQDICEIAGNDCNNNTILDRCDIDSGFSPDVDNTQIPDECEDCNNNGALDTLDIANCPTGFANAAACADCNNDRIPDGCQGDTDNDGTFDPCDGCPNDFLKIAPGACGCGTPDTDTDGDGTPNCSDGCPTNASKTSPGSCGCGTPETDTDSDGVPDCIDVCSNGNDSIDADNDGTPDCADDCPNDANETEAGACGCGVPEVDPDFDGIPDCNDNCPLNANAPPTVDGDQLDADGDGRGDACDACPNDANKTAIGTCGCGTADVDNDGDGVLDCVDNCPADVNANQDDSDGDDVGDLCDECPDDANKGLAGECGCGVSDADSDLDGVANCNDTCPGTPPGALVGNDGCVIPQAQVGLPDAACETAADCGAGEDCVEDVCIVSSNGCVSEADCLVGESCVLNVCTDASVPEAACDDDGDCFNGQSCVGGVCVLDAASAEAADCGADVPCGGTGSAAMLLMLLGFSRMKTHRPRECKQR